jgi:hypothetical protein
LHEITKLAGYYGGRLDMDFDSWYKYHQSREIFTVENRALN